MQSSVESIEKPLGVIDAYQRGFNTINRHPWLLLLPVLLDVVLWRAPRLTITPLVERALALLFSQPELPPELAGNAGLVTETFTATAANLNLLGLLSGSITGFPSFLSRLDANANIGTAVSIIQLDSLSQVFAYIAILIPAGLLVASVWLATMVRSLDEEGHERRNMVRHIGWIWLNTGLYVGGLVLATLATTGLLVLIIGVLAMLVGSFGLAAANLLWVLVLWIGLWLAIGLTFVIDAIALDGVNVMRASWRSINVVGRNLGGTLGLLIIAIILSEGFARIWLRLSTSAWGVPIGIIGNAYIGTALTAASLYFYRARYRYWQQIRTAMLSARRRDPRDPDNLSF
ncbi:MAG: hypothetical protein D6791_17490 [Chloroflexi bacterium]|nr:MAG: hypothetical protein D6791_17490 [Chloroflexota bacterium]